MLSICSGSCWKQIGTITHAACPYRKNLHIEKPGLKGSSKTAELIVDDCESKDWEIEKSERRRSSGIYLNFIMSVILRNALNIKTNKLFHACYVIWFIFCGISREDYMCYFFSLLANSGHFPI